MIEPLPSTLLPEYPTLHTVDFLQPLATSKVDSMPYSSEAELIRELTSSQISLQPSSEYFTNSLTPTVSGIEAETIAEKLSTSLFVPFLLPMSSLGIDHESSTEMSTLSLSRLVQTHSIQTVHMSASKVFDSSQTLIAANATSSVVYLMPTSVAEGFKNSQTGFPTSQIVQSASLDRQFAYTPTTTVELLEPFPSNSQFDVFSISVTTESGLPFSDIPDNFIFQPKPSMLLSGTTEQIVSSAIESISTTNEFITSTVYPSETMPLETLSKSEEVLSSFTGTQKARSTLIELSSTEDDISHISLTDNPEPMPQSFLLEPTTVFFDKTESSLPLMEQSIIFSKILPPTGTVLSSSYPSSSDGSAATPVMSFSTHTPQPSPSSVLLSKDVVPTEKESAVELSASQTITTIRLQSETESVFMNEEIFPSSTKYVSPNISSSLPTSEQLTTPNDFVSNTFNSNNPLLINSTYESILLFPKTLISADITNIISEDFLSPSVASSENHIEIFSTAEAIFQSPFLVFSTTSSDQESEIYRSIINITPLSSIVSSQTSTLASSNDDLLFPESTSDIFIERSTHTTLEYESLIFPSPTIISISEFTSFFPTTSVTFREIAESTSNILSSTQYVPVFQSPHHETNFPESTTDAFSPPILVPSESQYGLQSSPNNEEIFPSSSQLIFSTPFVSDREQEQSVSPTDTTNSLTSSDNIVTFSGSASDSRFKEISTLPIASESFVVVPSITEGIPPIFFASTSLIPHSTSALFSNSTSEGSTVISSVPATQSDSFIPKTSFSSDVTEITSEGFVLPSLAPSHYQTEVLSTAKEMLQSSSLLLSSIAHSSEQEQELSTSIDDTVLFSTISHDTFELISSSGDLLSPQSTSDTIFDPSVRALLQSESFIHPSPTDAISEIPSFFQVPLSTFTETSEKISSTPSSTTFLSDFDILPRETMIPELTSRQFISPSPTPSKSQFRLRFTSVTENIFVSSSPPVFLTPSTSALELEEPTSTIDASAVIITSDIDRSKIRSSTDSMAFSGSISSIFSMTSEVLFNTEEIFPFSTQSSPVLPTPSRQPAKSSLSLTESSPLIYPNTHVLTTPTPLFLSLYSNSLPGSATIISKFSRSLLMPKTQSFSDFLTAPIPSQTPTLACTRYILEIVPPYFFLTKLTLVVTTKEYQTLLVPGSKERCSLEMALANLFEIGLREGILVKREIREYDESDALERGKRSNEARMFNEDHRRWKRQAENEEYSATVSV